VAFISASVVVSLSQYRPAKHVWHTDCPGFVYFPLPQGSGVTVPLRQKCPARQGRQSPLPLAGVPTTSPLVALKPYGMYVPTKEIFISLLKQHSLIK